MPGRYAASNRASMPLLAASLDAVQLFCLLGVTISLAVIMQLDMEGLIWVLSHIE
jgi:hypothetical protein